VSFVGTLMMGSRSGWEGARWWGVGALWDGRRRGWRRVGRCAGDAATPSERVGDGGRRGPGTGGGEGALCLWSTWTAWHRS